ncbi:terpene synthase family protein [Aspergillus saccharolyticus JOP 1030-1]|uniref:Ent-kaurene synthase n=1 Tax=Aspergillus saccharolyticus JOP 1030-1 TaxID=1450539 RepID=A0A319ACC8_9EURO|nr:Ent-kaurene synthase [Aspergillus saccharolyticus JOP 1030-1]PYH49308.1 Ent-kaurene synthase [Aspergillus saccharolyticus JOP 1030-1]
MRDNSVATFIEMKNQCLYKSFANSHHPTYGLGTMSGNIYDTAWVSLVRKPNEGGATIWAFPEAFSTLLQLQELDGSWGSSIARLDTIANTLAALLALQKHAADPGEVDAQELNSRILKAKQFLDTALQELNELTVTSILPVSFELRLPAMLDLLEAEGHTFDFNQTNLVKLQARKMSKIDLDLIFSGPQSSLLHSLEALVGKIDFSGLAQHKVLGSMLGSPSATSAYLMYSPVWDNEAENYIRRAISNGVGLGSGLVAAGYPTTVFEWAWVTTNLLRNGIAPTADLQRTGEPIEAEIKQHGLVGFVPKACPDADDTAKALVALMLQGKHYSPQVLVDRFERETHFATYSYETHKSISTNANVLTALVLLSTDDHYQPQIEKCVRYLCEEWFKCDRLPRDKWNISSFYPTMLMCEALMSYLQRWSTGDLAALPDDLMNFHIPITLFQAVIRTVRTQNQDGSWGSAGSAEETAYGLLILKSVASFSLTERISSELKDAVRRGIEFILSRDKRCSTDDQLWLDKTLYSIPTVSDSYIMAAVTAGDTETPSKKAAAIPSLLVDIPAATVRKMAEFFTPLPSQMKTPQWVVEASVVEALLFSYKLKDLDVFSTGNALGEKYIKFAACFWTLANNSRPGYLLSTRIVYSMVELSVGIFQEDDLMERDLVALPDSASETIAEFIEQLCHGTNGLCQDHSSHARPTLETNGKSRSALSNVQHNLAIWFHFVLDVNLATARPSPADRRDLRQEVSLATIAAIQQAKAHRSLSINTTNGHDQKQPDSRESATTPVTSGQSFFTWLHTSAVHDVKSAVVSKSLVCKLGSEEKGDVFPTAREKYLAERLWRQISVEGRLWNDLGSIERDRRAANLNSVDFPEFSSPQSLQADGDVQTQLRLLAEYEHSCTIRCLEDLVQILEDSGRRRLSLYLQMYYLCCKIYSETCVMYHFGSTTVM